MYNKKRSPTLFLLHIKRFKVQHPLSVSSFKMPFYFQITLMLHVYISVSLTWSEKEPRSKFSSSKDMKIYAHIAVPFLVEELKPKTDYTMV